MRVVFMGTPDFATPALRSLIESRHDVLAVVTQPDKEAGRGRRLREPAVKELARDAGIREILQPERLRDEAFAQRLARLTPDAIVVVAYGKILPPSLLALPRWGCVNLHASLLPRHRGAGPVHRAIIEGDAETGVTIMKMDEGMDTGDIIAQETVPILEDDDALSLSNMLSVVGAKMLLAVLDEADRAGEGFRGRPQDESLATYAPPLKKEDGWIDWRQTTNAIMRLVRGLTPKPGAYTTSSRGILKVFRIECLPDDEADCVENSEGVEPGTVALIHKALGVVVRTGDGFLLLTGVQPEGKNAMSGVDLANGKYTRKGDHLGVPDNPRTSS